LRLHKQYYKNNLIKIFHQSNSAGRVAMENEEPPREEKADALATFLFLAFLLIVGFIFVGYWSGSYPFTANSVGAVSLASPIALIILSFLAFLSLVGGMIRARYPRWSIIIILIVGLVILVILSDTLLFMPVNPFQLLQS
jgi:cellulose synthase/poly-beta-1,6-N-acetylglucosamine synthase-like glycosyltransferase